MARRRCKNGDVKTAADYFHLVIPIEQRNVFDALKARKKQTGQSMQFMAVEALRQYLGVK